MKFCLENYLQDFSQIASSCGMSREEYGCIGDYELCVWQRASVGRTIYISTGMHGDEPAGCGALCAYLESYGLADAFSWVIFPALNPSGLKAGTRCNAHGVDLNRDYKRVSSVEVKSHCKWLNNHGPFDLFLSLHEDWESEGFYMYEINTSEYQPEGLTEKVLNAVERKIPLQKMGVIDEHQMHAGGLIRHRAEADFPEQWPEAIYHSKHYKQISYTFESPSAFPLEQRVKALSEAVRVAVASYAELVD